jgi:transposase
MEATGVYHESLAVHIHKLKFNVSIVLPNNMRYCAKSLNIKTKTDGVALRHKLLLFMYTPWKNNEKYFSLKSKNFR